MEINFRNEIKTYYQNQTTDKRAFHLASQYFDYSFEPGDELCESCQKSILRQFGEAVTRWDQEQIQAQNLLKKMDEQDQSITLEVFELGAKWGRPYHHGDMGCNGCRGAVKNLLKKIVSDYQK